MKTTLRSSLLIAASLLAFPVLAEDAKTSSEVKPVVDSKPAASGKDFVIINLDGEDIKNSDVMDVWKGIFQGKDAPDFAGFDENIRQNVLRGIVSERLIYKEAIKGGFDKNEEVKKRIENLQKQLVIQSFMENKAKLLVTDDQIKALYEEKLAASKGQEELKARHILVATEEEAKKISDDVKKNGDFEKIAKEKSTDQGSGANGGDLGWFAKDKMVPEFFEAAFKLKKGDVSAPVKSSFGWHIIKLEDRRPLKIAALAESKEALKGELSNKTMQSYVEGLLKTASIKYFDENGKEKEFARALVVPKADEKPKTDEKPKVDEKK